MIKWWAEKRNISIYSVLPRSPSIGKRRTADDRIQVQH